MCEITRLPESFHGRRDVSDYDFRRVYSETLPDGRNAYVYEQSYEGKVVGYEAIRPHVMEDKNVSVVDGRPVFTGTGEIKEFYPSSEQWGTHGFTARSYERAVDLIRIKFAENSGTE